MNGTMANAYNYMAAQLGHSTYPATAAQYCNTTELTPYADPMGQVGARNSTAAWYGANADPRLASKYCALQ